MSIKVYLSTCENIKPVTLGGKTYHAGHRELIEEAKLEILANDILKISIPGIANKPSVGKASQIDSISVRVCENTISIIAIYKEHLLNVFGCCACCTTADGTRICVYGDSGCDPGCP
ncbi:MAG: hypothetical protein PHI11_12470 [Gallionella sp.]|nr:hypothetical protein [Gallionella sp.]